MVSTVNLLLGEWVGLNLTYFFELFLCDLLWYGIGVPCQFLPPCHTTFTTHIRIEQKQKFLRIPSLNVVYYYYIYYHHNLNNNDNYLNPATYITNKNQYFLFYLFSENTTRRPWHWITNRAQQDQPYSNESLEIQTHNHLLKDNSRQSEVLCGYYGNQKKILRFFWNFGMSADIALAGHRLGELRKLIPKFTPPEGRGHTLTYETLTYQYQLLL